MISILLASYNGEKYISQQIESILMQTEQRFVLHIQDDCSTDCTYEIAKAYAKKYPEKIIVTRNEKNSGSAKHNFIRMMIENKDQYVMLCDQDDIWFPNKIEMTLKKIKEMEFEYGEETPLLVHTDLTVVDEDLSILNESFRVMMNADYSKTALKNQIVQNTMTGCTCMYNKALANFIQCEPRYMVMHDWWIMLIAACFGRIGTVYKPSILYRQHSKNVVGVRNMKSFRFMGAFFMKKKKIKEALNDSYRQAESFAEAFGDRMCRQDFILVKRYSEMIKQNKIKRLFTIIRLGTYKNGLFRKIAQILYL